MSAPRLEPLHNARYALLRSFRRDGMPVDTPVWFALDDDAVLFRTKIGSKTRRLAARPHVELTACDYRGRCRPDATPLSGHATILSGSAAEAANHRLHRRYGWQWNIVPLIKMAKSRGVVGFRSCGWPGRMGSGVSLRAVGWVIA